jgi:hypothetical protein
MKGRNKGEQRKKKRRKSNEAMKIKKEKTKDEK